jgi:TolA-binding protein
MARAISERITAAQEEVKQLEAHIKQLLQAQKVQERKERNHRLCKRGGLVEKLLPGLARLTDEEFDIFVEKTLLSGYAERILKGLLPPPPAPGQTDNADPAQGGGTIAETSAAEHNPGANRNGGTPAPARAAS